MGIIQTESTHLTERYHPLPFYFITPIFYFACSSFLSNVQGALPENNQTGEVEDVEIPGVLKK